jgi:fructokinase
MKLGIDLGGSKIEIIALDNQGVELLRRRVQSPQGDYSATLHAIENLAA